MKTVKMPSFARAHDKTLRQGVILNLTLEAVLKTASNKTSRENLNSIADVVLNTAAKRTLTEMLNSIPNAVLNSAAKRTLTEMLNSIPDAVINRASHGLNAVTTATCIGEQKRKEKMTTGMKRGKKNWKKRRKNMYLDAESCVNEYTIL